MQAGRSTGIIRRSIAPGKPGLISGKKNHNNLSLTKKNVLTLIRHPVLVQALIFYFLKKHDEQYLV